MNQIELAPEASPVAAMELNVYARLVDSTELLLVGGGDIIINNG